MNNNDTFKKLRVALQLRDDQIVEILELVDFRISKAELGAFFRNQDHPNYMECGDQVLRNFLNGLILHLRGTKEAPKNPQEVIGQNKQQVASAKKTAPASKPAGEKKTGQKPFSKNSKAAPKKIQVVEKVRFKNGKDKN